MGLHYDTIIQSLNDCFPELTQYEECRSIIAMLDESEYLPYLYFPAFWKILECVLTNKITDKSLQDRIFLFMEEMAKSDDHEVVNLMQIEMLEPIFGLDYNIYRNVVFRFLLPESLKLHEAHKDYFHIPSADMEKR